MSYDEILNLAMAKFSAEADFNPRLSTRRQIRFGSKGSISVQTAGDKAGAWYDFSSGKGGWLNGSADSAAHPHQASAPYSYDHRRSEIVKAYLGASKPAQNTPVELYLRNRGIRCPIPHSVRYLPSPPGMVTMYQNRAGDTLAIQITYLTRDGRKAERSVAKQTFATGDGWHRFSSVRIPGRGELILCEGIENGLTLHQETGRPVWSCGSVSNIAVIKVKQKRFTIATDGDEPDSPAAITYQNAFMRFIREGKSIKVAAPPVGRDFNKVLLGDGGGRVLEIVLGAVQCRA